MSLLKIFLSLNPNGTYLAFVEWYKSLSSDERDTYKYNLELLKGTL